MDQTNARIPHALKSLAWLQSCQSVYATMIERYVPVCCVNSKSLFSLLCRTFEESVQPKHLSVWDLDKLEQDILHQTACLG